MPDAAAAQPQGRDDGPQQGFLRTALQSVGMFLLIQFAMKQVGNYVAPANSTRSQVNDAAPVAPPAPKIVPPYQDRPALSDIEGPYSALPVNIAPAWPEDVIVDISMYVSESQFMPLLSKVPGETLVLRQTGFKLGDSKDTRDVETSIKVPRSVQNNGTLYAHLYVSQAGSANDPSLPDYDPSRAYHLVRPLNQFLVKKRQAKTRNLLSSTSGESADEGIEDDPKQRVVSSYYHPNLTLSVITGSGTQAFQHLHPATREWVQLESTGSRDLSGQNGWYYPIVYFNTFWQLRQHMTELNTTVEELPLNIHLKSMPNWQFNIISALDFGIRTNAAKYAAGESLPGGGDGSEMEQIKSIILDSNIYLLSTTVIVGLLHSIFELLAFKNDVSHWRNKKDNVGISVRTILANVFMKAVVFLYLYDQMQETSYMILVGEGFGVLIEAWKITKCVDVRIVPTPAASTDFPWRYLPYTVLVEDKHKLSETEEKTKEYDEIAFKYMYWIAIPLLLAYAAYSLYYESHKSWYSFVLTTLVGSVYAYGFLLMVPSLYINYRLKSVAHMPGRAMTYKFLNTFIDDLFAFTVKMPLLHRLATLRDDVIFFIYLYQCYVYKIDYTRVNEFGQGGDDEEVTDKIAAESTTSPAKSSISASTDAALKESVQATSTSRSTGTVSKRR